METPPPRSTGSVLYSLWHLLRLPAVQPDCWHLQYIMAHTLELANVTMWRRQEHGTVHVTLRLVRCGRVQQTDRLSAVWDVCAWLGLSDEAMSQQWTRVPASEIEEAPYARRPQQPRRPGRPAGRPKRPADRAPRAPRAGVPNVLRHGDR